MPVADTNIDSWAATTLDPGRDFPPTDSDIFLTFLACAQAIDYVDPGMHVALTVTAQNGIPEFLLRGEGTTATVILATWEPVNRRLYVRDLASPRVNKEVHDTVYRARFYLTLLRQCQHKWGDGPLRHGVTDLVRTV